MKSLFADSVYDRTKLMAKAADLDFTVAIARRLDAEPGFTVLPQRGVFERTFTWMTRWRRLVRDYKARIDISGGMIQLAMASLLLRRVAAWSGNAVRLQPDFVSGSVAPKNRLHMPSERGTLRIPCPFEINLHQFIRYINMMH